MLLYFQVVKVNLNFQSYFLQVGSFIFIIKL